MLFVFGVALSVSCTKAKQSENATTVTSTSASPQTTASPLEKPAGSATPTLAEVNEAIQRVYVNTVEMDAGRTAPFITGDFNGDGSQDLAVVVRPVKGALSKLNSEYANWVLEDPRKIVLPDPNKAVQELPKPPAREKVQQDDLLLLVLHGYGERGWHHPYARQTFLLRNAVGDDMRAESWNEISKTAGDKNGGNRQQQPGDLIRERLANQDGFLYWTQGKYAWRH